MNNIRRILIVINFILILYVILLWGLGYYFSINSHEFYCENLGSGETLTGVIRDVINDVPLEKAYITIELLNSFCDDYRTVFYTFSDKIGRFYIYIPALIDFKIRVSFAECQSEVRPDRLSNKHSLRMNFRLLCVLI